MEVKINKSMKWKCCYVTKVINEPFVKKQSLALHILWSTNNFHYLSLYIDSIYLSLIIKFWWVTLNYYFQVYNKYFASHIINSFKNLTSFSVQQFISIYVPRSVTSIPISFILAHPLWRFLVYYLQLDFKLMFVSMTRSDAVLLIELLTTIAFIWNEFKKMKLMVLLLFYAIKVLDWWKLRLAIFNELNFVGSMTKSYGFMSRNRI